MDPDLDPNPFVRGTTCGSGSGSAPKCHGSPTLIEAVLMKRSRSCWSQPFLSLFYHDKKHNYRQRFSPPPLLAGAVKGSVQTGTGTTHWECELYCQTIPFILLTVKNAVELLGAPSRNSVLMLKKYNITDEIFWLSSHVFFFYPANEQESSTLAQSPIFFIL